MSEGSYKLNDGCDPSKTTYNNFGLTVKITQTNINYLTTTNASELGSKSTKKANNIYSGINIIVNQGTRWTNKQLDITASLPFSQVPRTGNLIDARYIWNKNPDNTTTTPSHTTNVHEFYNELYYLDIYTKENEHFQNSFKYSYDQQKPVLYEDKTRYANPLDENVWKKSKTILIYVTDNEGVGLDRIYAGSKPCSDILKDPNMGVAATPHSDVQPYEVNDVEAGKDGENGLINICVTDKLGNLTTGQFRVKKIDITPPQCDRVVGDHNKYQYTNRTVHQYCYDNNVINGKKVIGSGCTHGEDTPYEKTWSTTTTVGTIKITDNVGWTTDCQVNVYVDKTPPVCGTAQGAGSTSQWNQEERDINQYCIDYHVGCKQPYYHKHWSKALGEYITTDTITIYDKDILCSQKSPITNSNDCRNYDSIKNTEANEHNNSTVCTVGVYIDHVEPYVVTQSLTVAVGNSAKLVCKDDCHGDCPTDNSGVKTFKATFGGTTKTNSDGSALKFKMNSEGSYTVSYECEDNAGNKVTGSKTYTVETPPSSGNVSTTFGKTCTYNGKTCHMGNWRSWSQVQGCSLFSYDCVCEDKICSNSTNQGAGSTCCLTGEDKKYGCKQSASSDTDFGTYLPFEAVGGYDNVLYANYNSEYYVYPTSMSYCMDNGVSGSIVHYKCTHGRKCLHFNCYMDNPGTQRPMQFICGNYSDDALILPNEVHWTV